jgi:hypothetical protein
MTRKEPQRRQLLQLGVTAGAGLAFGCLAGGPCGQLLAADPYLMTAYCCARCDECDLYRFRQCSTCKYKKGRGGCKVRSCAEARNVPTCAHCTDFPTCDKEFWTKNPEAKKRAEELRRELAKQRG